MIFETERLIIRRLVMSDLQSFHEMQSNPKVMQFADGEVKSLEEHQEELQDLINKYNIKHNDFWIYAIENKQTNNFIGTVALVKDENDDDEIGYRFLEKYWKNGYGAEVCKGLVDYCKTLNMNKLIGFVVDKNVASIKILEQNKFKKIHEFIDEDHFLVYKYQLIL